LRYEDGVLYEIRKPDAPVNISGSAVLQ